MTKFEKAKVKLNNGRGALLCTGCDVIIDYGIDHEDKYHYCDNCAIVYEIPEHRYTIREELEGNNDIQFRNKNGELVGALDYKDGVFKFTGEAEESAKIFFEYLEGFLNETGV